MCVCSSSGCIFGHGIAAVVTLATKTSSSLPVIHEFLSWNRQAKRWNGKEELGERGRGGEDERKPEVGVGLVEFQGNRIHSFSNLPFYSSSQSTTLIFLKLWQDSLTTETKLEESALIRPPFFIYALIFFQRFVVPLLFCQAVGYKAGKRVYRKALPHPEIRLWWWLHCMLWVAVTYVQHIIPLSVRYSHADMQRGACLSNNDCFHFFYSCWVHVFFLYINPPCSTLSLNLMTFMECWLFYNSMLVVLALVNGLCMCLHRVQPMTPLWLFYRKKTFFFLSKI